MIAPGVCLTFDDFFVENWCAARPVFDAHDARVTFCVCWMHAATPAQIDGLRQLQDDGHEIAYHGRDHKKLRPYLREHGLATWLDQEITRGVAEHRALGFPATSYAAPFHGSNPRSRRATGTQFLLTRAKGAHALDDAAIRSRIYRSPLPDGAVHSLASVDVEHGLFPGWDALGAMLDLVVQEGGVGILNGHDLRDHDTGRARFTRLADLDRLLGAIADRGLAFHTLSGFARATRPAAAVLPC